VQVGSTMERYSPMDDDPAATLTGHLTEPQHGQS